MTLDTYAIYLRKSRADLEKEQQGQFETLKHHEQILTEYAKNHGLNVVKIYRELASGDSIASRPEMIKLLNDVDNGLYKGVLVTELSRLARGRTADQSVVSDTFQRSHTLIVTPSKVYDPTDDTDDTYIDFELFMARQEYKYIKKRMQAGRQRSALNGNWIHAKPPFGWSVGDLTLIPNSDSEFARHLLESYADGSMTLYRIRETMTKHRGVRCYNTYVTNWLKNPAHCGYMIVTTKDGQVEVKGTWDGIISKETHDQIVARCGSNPRSKTGVVLRNQFSGILRCAKCGRAMIYCPSEHGGRLKHPPKKEQPIDGICDGVASVYLSEFTQMIADALEDSIPSMEIKLNATSRKHNTKPIEDKIKNLESRKKLLYSFLEDGTYTPEEFRDRRSVLQDQIQTLQDELTQIKDEPVITNETIVTTKQAIDLLRDPDADVKTVNDFLKSIIDRIDYDRKTGEEPEIVIHPKKGIKY